MDEAAEGEAGRLAKAVLEYTVSEACGFWKRVWWGYFVNLRPAMYALSMTFWVLGTQRRSFSSWNSLIGFQTPVGII